MNERPVIHTEPPKSHGVSHRSNCLFFSARQDDIKSASATKGRVTRERSAVNTRIVICATVRARQMDRPADLTAELIERRKRRHVDEDFAGSLAGDFLRRKELRGPSVARNVVVVGIDYSRHRSTARVFGSGETISENTQNRISSRMTRLASVT